MERILTAWLKTALPNLSRDEGHKLLRLISLREKLMYKNHKPSVPIAVDREHTLKQSRGEQKLNFTYDGNIWNNINKFPIDVKTNVGVVGLEFLLATYLWNRLANRPNDQWAGGTIVEDRVTRFVKKTLTAMLFDSRIRSSLTFITQLDCLVSSLTLQIPLPLKHSQRQINNTGGCSMMNLFHQTISMFGARMTLRVCIKHQFS